LRRVVIQSASASEGADVHAQHLAAAVAIDAYGGDDRHRHVPPVLADLDVGGIDPEVRPVASMASRGRRFLTA
jgi:hypothetical protein